MNQMNHGDGVNGPKSIANTGVQEVHGFPDHLLWYIFLAHKLTIYPSYLYHGCVPVILNPTEQASRIDASFLVSQSHTGSFPLRRISVTIA